MAALTAVTLSPSIGGAATDTTFAVLRLRGALRGSTGTGDRCAAIRAVALRGGAEVERARLYHRGGEFVPTRGKPRARSSRDLTRGAEDARAGRAAGPDRPPRRASARAALTGDAASGERCEVRFRRRAPGILIATVTVVILAVVAIANLLTGRMADSAKTANYELMRDILASILRSTEDKALVRAELVASMQSVRGAFAARDRGKLLAECERMFRQQDEKYGLDQAQFHVPPGVSFLRLHKPEAFGDDQTSYRPMLVDVHANKVLRKGVVISKAGPAISGIVPVFDDAGAFVGSFEMGLELAPMLDKIKEAYGMEAAVFIDEKMLREVAGESEAEHLSPKNRVGRFVRYHSTHPELAAALVTDREVEISEPTNYERAVGGVSWGVQLVPMYSYSGKQIGVYALAESFANAKSEANRARVWMLLSALFAIVLTAGVILVIVRGVLVSPLGALGERLRALAAGDASQPADPLDSYCEELQEVARAYEQLRAARPQGERPERPERPS